MADESFPWSVKLPIAEIPAEGLHRDIRANDAECAALAAMADSPSITGLVASLDIVPELAGRFRVTGTVKGSVAQTCVVTLEPLDSKIDEPVEATFAPVQEVEAALARLSAADPDEETPDPPEAIKDGRIDIGALAAEFFLLAIDPYPRKPGVEFQPIVPPEAPEDHPFAALAALKGDKPK